MPRIRSLKHTFFSDERLAEYPRDVRLTFIGLITHADDEGRLKGDPRLVKADVWPLDDDITAAVVSEHLSRLASGENPRIDWYVVDGLRYIAIRNFKKHQYIQKPRPSDIPAPENATGEVSDDSDTPTGKLPDGYALDGMGMDGNRKGKRKKPPAARAADSGQPEKPKSGNPTWLTPAKQAWEAQFGPGSFREKQAAGLLAPLRRAGVADDEIGRRLAEYVKRKKGGYCTLADFAAHHGEYVPVDRGPALLEGGVMSDWLERETRPPGMDAPRGRLAS